METLGMQSINVMQTAQEKFKTKMQVDNFNATLQQGQASNTKTQKDEFMRILVTQLKNQNPLEPVKDKDFIAQMAQLSSVEKLEELNSNITKMGNAAGNTTMFNLIGKNVEYIDHNGAQSLGIIDSVNMKDGMGFISIDGNEVNLSDIVKIKK